MSIEETWKNIGTETDEALSKLLKPSSLGKLQSTSPLARIQGNMLMNSIWGILIGIGYILILIYFPFWQVRLCISLVLLFTIWAVYTTLKLYNNIRIGVPEHSVLSEMERHYQNIKKWMSLQQWVGLLIYPISAVGGFMLGGALGSGRSVDEVLAKPKMVIAMIIVAIILVPLGYLLAKWMSKKAFGNHLAALKRNIDALKEKN